MPDYEKLSGGLPARLQKGKQAGITGIRTMEENLKTLSFVVPVASGSMQCSIKY